MRTTQPASFGDIEFDAIIDRSEQLKGDVPEYATEKGYSTSDNISLSSIVLEVTAVFSNAPVTWSDRHAASLSRVESMCEELRQCWLNKTVATFTAGSDAYDNMCIESCTLPRQAENGTNVRMSLTLKQVTVTEAETANVSIKYARGGTSSQSTGAAQTKSSSKDSGSSSASSSSSSETSKTNKSLILWGAEGVTKLISKIF